MSQLPRHPASQKALTPLSRPYRVRTWTIFLDPHRPRFTLDAIEASPSLERPVALKDGDVSVSVQRLADDVDFPARVMPMLNELPAQRRDWASGGASVSTGSKIHREAAFDVTGYKRADQFNGVRGGDDRRDQCRIPFLLVMMC